MENSDIKYHIKELDNEDARAFFLKGDSYSTAELPPYFSFDEFLSNIEKEYSQLLDDWIKNKKDGKESLIKRDLGNAGTIMEGVNYKLIQEKDKYRWRDLQLIHPVLYIGLVNEITKLESWSKIQNRLKSIEEKVKPNIECISHPIKSSNSEKNKAEQIRQWSKKFQIQSLELALEYEYMITTDIQSCYSSIYTHTIAWAIHTKDVAKGERGTRDDKGKVVIGNMIDKFITAMNGGQTNGLPQGSILMNFIAEIVLSYGDEQIFDNINKNTENKIGPYKILRYRDDYRIFVKNQADGELILRVVSESLRELNFQLNSTKTNIQDNIIEASFKADKLYNTLHGRLFKDVESSTLEGFYNQMLYIHDLSRRFPGSGSLVSLLQKYINRIERYEKEGEKPKFEPYINRLISIITDIAVNNPRIHSHFCITISKLISYKTSKEEKEKYYKLIEEKFKKKAYTEMFEIWMQRISYPLNIKSQSYKSKLCKLISEDLPIGEIWDSRWLQDEGSGLEGLSFISWDNLEDLEKVAESGEINTFIDYP
eukprot:COSAG01_NODE_3175_length_6465_cov_2.887527_3_plen_539_part_00